MAGYGIRGGYNLMSQLDLKSIPQAHVEVSYGQDEHQETIFTVPRPEILSLDGIKNLLGGGGPSPSRTEENRDPGEVYPDLPGLGGTYETFRLRPEGLTDTQRKHALEVARSFLDEQQSTFMGFQANQALDYSPDLSHYLDKHLNNIGDPFGLGSFRMNTKFMERPLLDYFASLWNARWPNDVTDRESYWGFALTMGSTEGNQYAMWNGRDYLSGKVLLYEDTMTRSGARGKPRPTYFQASVPDGASGNCFTPVAFFSGDTHYSFAKATTIMQIKTFSELGEESYPGECPLPGSDGAWPHDVPSSPNGEGSIDVDSLATLVEFFVSRGYPIFVNFNYGTTFKGAYDDVKAAGDRLIPILKQYGMYERSLIYDTADPERYVVTRHGFWFHVDGALGAAYMPFVEMAKEKGLIDQAGPSFDFRNDFVSSISVSGHKWIGAPAPTGVFMTRTKYQLQPPEIPEYIGTPDTTFAGSRSGLAVLLMWDYFARKSQDELIQKALQTVAVADYIEAKFRQLEKELGEDLFVHHTPLALTVVFKRPKDELVDKYSMSNDTDDLGRDVSHIFAMEHVTFELVDRLIDDLREEGAFDRGTAPARRYELVKW